jgi:hypothetical protein
MPANAHVYCDVVVYVNSRAMQDWHTEVVG